MHVKIKIKTRENAKNAYDYDYDWRIDGHAIDLMCDFGV